MTLQLPHAEEDPARYLKVIQDSVSVCRHADLLRWLQGDLQHYLPHAVMVAGWGDFLTGSLQHDIVSAIPGIRSYAADTESIPLLLRQLHSSWVAGGRRPCVLDFRNFSHLLGSSHRVGPCSTALRCMRSAMVYGMYDERGRQESIYVLLSADEIATTPVASRDASTAVLIACIDMALRRITHLPQQRRQAQPIVTTPRDDSTGLSEREAQIMAWVAMGKTNSEIGTILNISGYTVKNHMQRIFQKLNVFNRTQAVSKAGRVTLDG